ncbi:MAG: DNA polymerase IV [Acutalibacteraceae bacterium]|nr:DNA polymerase IV [Clostridia bacterium]MEE1330483.1 DNA polymerase IV [Acutalibacteraceae bacterium]
MRDRVILHCDLNNFFASVSLLSNPTLKNLPVAVCGDKENRHGIVLAKNDIAKKFNVKTAEAIFEAKKKCPELVILPPLMDEYKRYSKLAGQIYSRYTDMIEPFGIDECWLDVTGSTLIFGSGESIANKIRNDIKSELGITVSVGVSFNKIFAKLGSDMKKPDAVTVIPKDGFKEKIWGLPVSDMLFAGKHTAEKLKTIGVCTIGDLAVCDNALLNRLLGKNGTELKRYALGEDTSPVVSKTKDDKPKSIGRSVTTAKDFVSFDEVWSIFLSLSQSVSDSLHRHGLYASGVQVHIRTASLKVKEFSRTYPDTTDSAYIIAKRGADILKANYDFKEPLRSVGIRAVSLKNCETAIQQDMFGAAKKLEAQEKIEDSIYELRKKFGDSSIRRASASK